MVASVKSRACMLNATACGIGVEGISSGVCVPEGADSYMSSSAVAKDEPDIIELERDSGRMSTAVGRNEEGGMEGVSEPYLWCVWCPVEGAKSVSAAGAAGSDEDGSASTVGAAGTGADDTGSAFATSTI